MLLLQDSLSADLQKQIDAVLARSLFSAQPPSLSTGANLADFVRNNLYRGMAFYDTKLLLLAMAKQSADIDTHSIGEDGIMFDAAFHQHSVEVPTPRGFLQAGSYGLVFSMAILDLMTLTQGTQFSMARTSETLFLSLLLDGQRWMVTPAGTWDWHTIGRVITRNNALTWSIPFTAQSFMPFSMRQQELAAFAKELAGNGISLVGNKHFASSDYMSHRRPRWMATWRGTSSRTMPTQ